MLTGFILNHTIFLILSDSLVVFLSTVQKIAPVPPYLHRVVDSGVGILPRLQILTSKELLLSMAQGTQTF